ncbi:MAG: hypothetical protein ABIR96_09210, partial [Bdellovibrionota bacterium]
RSIASDANGHLRVNVDASAPNYCSGATYLVLLKTLQKLEAVKALSLSPETVKALGTAPDGKWLDDGHGVWGRWNANGPGTAGLFSDLGMGKNFSDDSFRTARPGDFMKIFWGDDVGKKETGHSVILTSVIPEGARGHDVREVCFWSSNSNQGFGTKCVERTKLKHIIFSRLTRPEKIADAGRGSLPEKNAYLASLLSHESSIAEALAQTRASTK